MNTTQKLLLGVVILVAVGAGGYYAWQYNASRGDLANLPVGAKPSDAQVAQLVSQISKFLVVPSDEQPSVAVISDAEQLASQQSFYKGSKNGDILVVYSSRAIIYDAKANKLVNVGPIVRNDTPPTSPAPLASGSATVTPSVSASPTPSVTPKAITVDVLNGSGTSGLAGATASKIKSKLFLIGRVGDAKGTYKATVLVDLTKDEAKAAAVAQLAKQLGVTSVTKMPTGEVATTADALVIVGK